MKKPGTFTVPGCGALGGLGSLAILIVDEIRVDDSESDPLAGQKRSEEVLIGLAPDQFGDATHGSGAANMNLDAQAGSIIVIIIRIGARMKIDWGEDPDAIALMAVQKGLQALHDPKIRLGGVNVGKSDNESCITTAIAGSDWNAVVRIQVFVKRNRVRRELGQDCGLSFGGIVRRIRSVDGVGHRTEWLRHRGHRMPDHSLLPAWAVLAGE